MLIALLNIYWTLWILELAEIYTDGDHYRTIIDYCAAHALRDLGRSPPPRRYSPVSTPSLIPIPTSRFQTADLWSGTDTSDWRTASICHGVTLHPVWYMSGTSYSFRHCTLLQMVCRNKVNSILKTPLNIFHFSNELQQFSFGYLHDLFHNK